ncbi:hypothetical protein Sjap_012070 [Stephania japonica]|uniref:Uncharacterized protein n=1 Tax=Stephania japonica TaxID=461633 RepID=A0AAP0NX92_9MAGN
MAILFVFVDLLHAYPYSFKHYSHWKYFGIGKLIITVLVYNTVLVNRMYACTVRDSTIEKQREIESRGEEKERRRARGIEKNKIGQETDFVLVSCAGLGIEPSRREQVIKAKKDISCADVADICVKALHDSTARNKSFDVCYEYMAKQGEELYELWTLMSHFMRSSTSAVEKWNQPQHGEENSNWVP